MSKISQDEKETAIETIRIKGTMKAGAESAGVTVRTLNEEMRRSAIFKRRVLEALEDGKSNLGDSSVEYLVDVRDGKFEKTDRNRVTAAIALANWGKPGFRGATVVQGKIDHDVRVLTAVPRPKYDIEISKADVKELDKPPKKVLKSKRIVDENGEYIGTQTVEDVIEGEVINDN